MAIIIANIKINSDNTMSLCIIPMRHWLKSISNYMGRLRFTLTNIIFWIVLFLSCLLSENFALLSNNNPMGGFSMAPAYILTFSILLLLVAYYLIERKKNGLKFDRILLPAFSIIGLLLIWTVLRQDGRTFIDYDGAGTFSFSLSASEKFLNIAQIVAWLAVLYALVFVYNRYRLNLESYRWVVKVYLLVIALLVIIDFFYEWDIIAGIFAGTYQGGGVQFFMGNANIWGLMIFTGILSALILSYKRFTWYYFASMVALYFFLIFTTSATAIYISTIVCIAYPVYEIFIHYKEDKKRTLLQFVIYLSVIATFVLLEALLVLVKVPVFVNFWTFINQDIFNKDFLTITGRTTIWLKTFDLLKGNPLDLIFGLGHKTGNLIFQAYINPGFGGIRSAHNGVMEIILRYGILGGLIYVGVLGFVVYCFILQIKKKNYRFAFIYGLGFIAVMLHSVAESTTLFTPNVGGLYFGFCFALPVMNIVQSKHMESLKKDLLSLDIKKENIPKKNYVIAFVFSMFTFVIVKFMKEALNLDILSSALVILLIILTAVIVLLMTNNKSLNSINNNILLRYKKRVSGGRDL